MSRVHAYLRASTAKQDASPATQEEIIRDYCKMQGLPDPIIYCDSGVSGKIPIDERPAGKELCYRLRKGDHVICSRLDRMFRSLSDAVSTMDRFERQGVRFHVCSMMGGALDLGSPMGRFLLHILAAFAELERAFISERIKEGIKHSLNDGYRVRKHTPIGFKKKRVIRSDKVKYLAVPDPDERAIMRQIVNWRSEDPPYSWESIYWHLREQKVTTADGFEWSVGRIRRAYKAELVLQLRESRGKGA